MPVFTAVGSDALLGVAIDDPSDIYECGHPNLQGYVTKPGAVTASLAGVGAGSVDDGAHDYGVSFVTAGGETPCSAVVIVTVVDKASDGKVAISAIPLGPAGTTARKLWRSEAAAHSMKLLTTLADNTTTVFTDNVADVALGAAAPVVNTATFNFGLNFLRHNSASGGPEYGMIQVQELGSLAGPRDVPGAITSPLTLVRPSRAGGLVPVLTALLGKPTKSTPATGVYRYLWSTPSTTLLTPRTLSMLWHKGSSSIFPEWLWDGFCSGIQWQVAQNALANEQATLAFQHHGLCGVATAVAGGAGYNGAVVCRGIRQDTDKLLPIFIKVTTAPTTGTFAIKVETIASGPTYGGSAQTLYYNLTSKFQTKGGSQVSDWYEVQNEGGDILGADSGNNRAPFEILFTGDITGLALNDEFKIEPTALIPSASTDAGFTKTAPSFVSGCKFTSAHTYLTLNGSVVEVHNATCNLGVPRAPYYAHGPEARFALDMPRNGYMTGQLTVARRFDARTYEALRHADTRIVGVFELRGPIIASTYREKCVVTFNQMAVSNTDSNVSNMNWIPETVTLMMEQPDTAGTEPVTVDVYSSHDWDVN